jgi:hypothetical protein
MSSTIYKSQLFGEVEVLLVKGPLFMEITIFVAMENGPLSSLIYLLTMVMFHRYVNVEGNSTLNHQMFLVQCPQKKKTLRAPGDCSRYSGFKEACRA